MVKHCSVIIEMSFIVVLIVLVSGIVYVTGGTSAAFTHLMYIPIFLSALFWGYLGVVGATVLGGLALGPFMPEKVTQRLIMQEPVNWMIRIFMFLIIGFIMTYLLNRVKAYKNSELERSYRNATTGLPNATKLQIDLNEMISKEVEFSLIVFRITNIDDVNRYIGREIGIKSILKIIELLHSRFKDCRIYSVYSHEFAVIMPKTGAMGAYLCGLEVINIFKEPIPVGQFNVELLINGGIVSYPIHATNADELISKAGVSLDIASDNESGLSVYNAIIEQKNVEKYELMCSLFHAIEQNELSIVYQPIINLHDHSPTSVEALLRWNHSEKGPVNPEEFIKIAEDIGLINKITEWLIKNVILQLKKWKTEGLSIKVALNFSAKDLGYITSNYLMDCLNENEIDPASLAIEITETSIVKHEKMASDILKQFRSIGLKISLDDFGTGFNSLKSSITLPVDIIKIDKVFIDNMNDCNVGNLIEAIIRYAKNTGRMITAEGVEDREQLKILTNMGCDNIQGYFYSKPLQPDEIKDYVLHFSENFKRT
ncbi:MAG: bifunctional diguanylate cyclase/phosphodiesterase [Lawsonibacter sp.]|nr:bifunctional diguanylate cyclase/phosphodiesterase [Lawsonibacter sp.]